MRKNFGLVMLIAVVGILFGGCVAIPPLINVQHKNDSSNIEKRLDSIDRRLDQLEKK